MRQATDFDEPVRGSAGDLPRCGLALLDAYLEGIEFGDAMEKRYGGDKRHARLVQVVRAAVDPLAPTSGSPGAELSGARIVAADFAAATRALSLLGRISAMRVPMNVPIPFIAARSPFGFVAPSGKIPAAKPTFAGNATLKQKSVKGICVITKELARASEAEAVLQRIMIDGAVEGIDAGLTDPAGTLNVARPASLVTLANDVYDGSSVIEAPSAMNLLRSMIGNFLSTGAGLRRAAWLTSSAIAIGLAEMWDAGAGFVFPGVTAAGGTLLGLPLYASDFVAPGVLVLVDGDALAVADESVARVAVSDAALIYMSDDGATHPVSAFGADLLALRVVREIDWTLSGGRAVAAIDIALPIGTVTTA